MTICVPLTLLFGVGTLTGLIFRKRLSADWILKRQLACFTGLSGITIDRFLVMGLTVEDTSNKYFGNFSDEKIAHYCQHGIPPEKL